MVFKIIYTKVFFKHLKITGREYIDLICPGKVELIDMKFNSLDDKSYRPLPDSIKSKIYNKS